ncbi:TIR domain-containing protein [Cladochytrium replicatum]|nr:TIR domain-containing protein [Cladochytrium replicatum]
MDICTAGSTLVTLRRHLLGSEKPQSEIERICLEFSGERFLLRKSEEWEDRLSSGEWKARLSSQAAFHDGTRQQSSSSRYHVMISYNQDRCQSLVRKLVDQLVKSGVEVWVDDHKMAGNIKKAMSDGVQNSRLFVPFVCEAYCKSDNCLFEFDKAVKADKDMAPVWLDDEPLSDNVKKFVDRYLWTAASADSTRGDQFLEEQASKIKESIVKTLLRVSL